MKELNEKQRADHLDNQYRYLLVIVVVVVLVWLVQIQNKQYFVPGRSYGGLRETVLVVVRKTRSGICDLRVV